MQKFFVNDSQILENKAKITGEDLNHIVNVLRLKIGEKILIGNKDQGTTYLSKIIEESDDFILVEILNKNIQNTEPKTYIHLFQGLPKLDKMEHIIQKGTEIRNLWIYSCYHVKMYC